jgi:hypothetical protein
VLGTPYTTERGFGGTVDADSPDFRGILIYRAEQLRVIEPATKAVSPQIGIVFSQGKVTKIGY